MVDKKLKGRAQSMNGETNGRSKLTAANVREIRADSRSRYIVGLEYGIHPATVSLIRSRKTWGHLQ